MIIDEYKVIKRDYGKPELKKIHQYETVYNGEIDYFKLADMLDEIFELSYCNEEYLYVIAMDTAWNIKGIYEAGHGDYGCVCVYSRELFSFLLLSGAEQFIIAHNHTNGILEASEGDKKWTMTMNMCANVLHIKFAEHLIMTEDGVICIKNECCSEFDNKVDWDSIKI